jgi:rubrerythrin
MATKHGTSVAVYGCPDCGGSIEFEAGSWQCPDCAYAPRHGAD